MITMAAMSQMCALSTTVIDRYMIVVGVDRNGLLLMIAAVLDSLRFVMCTAMVARMRRPVIIVAVRRLWGWIMEVRLTMVVIHFASR
jgi:hypothetical protein